MNATRTGSKRVRILLSLLGAVSLHAQPAVSIGLGVMSRSHTTVPMTSDGLHPKSISPNSSEGARPQPVAASYPQKSEHIGVCFQNERLIGKGSLKFTIEALRRYEKELRTDFDFSCASPNSVIITFRELPARELAQDALGAARLRGGRILPEIEIFRASVRRIIGVVPPSIEGQAFATIAAHEIRHYLLQQAGHTVTGLNGEFFTARDLMRGFE